MAMTAVRIRVARAAFLLAVAAVAVPRPAAAAEAASILVAEPFGVEFLPIRVALAERLIEKHAKSAGLGDIKVGARHFHSGIAVNRAVLSGHVDVGGVGLTEMLALWDRTRGTPFEARGVLALAAMPLTFVTTDPQIRELKDFAGHAGHRIAVPETRVSIHAVTLRMAAEKTFGPGQAAKFDPLLVALPPARAAAALAEDQRIRTHIASPPDSFREFSAGRGRIVARSTDIVGGAHTTAVLIVSRRWKEKNPKLFRAVADAMVEALAWLDQDPARAARFYRAQSKSKQDVSEIEAMLAAAGEAPFRPVPRNTMPYAAFLERTGAIKARADSWKDYFWETAHALDGG
jgi:NitT/TauT family transport system substrate-binding protein